MGGANANVFLIDDTFVPPGALSDLQLVDQLMGTEDLLLDADVGMSLAYSFTSDDLWLEITSATNATASLVIHPPASEEGIGVYDLFMTTNLAVNVLGLNGTNWQWVLRCDPGQTNLLVTNLTEDVCFFRLGRTNDADSDGMSDAFEMLVSHTDPNNGDQNGNGIPDGWEWSYFGSLQPGDADYDGDGWSNYDEYFYGSDPNTITFSVAVTNRYVNLNPVPIELTVSNGVPSSMAVLVDSTNFATATWLPYPAPVNVPSEGWHDVFIGLRGRLVSSEQTWQFIRFKLDLTPPVLFITNPVSSIVMQPMIEVQGFCPESLASLCYDLTNATGLVTNQQAFVLGQAYDTNTMEFTTNWFQAFDVEVTNGPNTFTFHAMDLAGNLTTTNVTFTLDYAAKTNSPVIQLFWPQEGAKISGSNPYTWRGWVQDFTAKVAASVIDVYGNTNVYDAVVERDGKFWVENLPAPTGISLLQLTVTDVAGNVSTTNIAVDTSPVVMTINAPQVSVDQVYCAVNGTINSSDYTVWVNGTKALLTGDSWLATNVPVSAGGTAVFQARAIPSSDNDGYGSAAGTGGGSGAVSRSSQSASNNGSGANPDSPQGIDQEIQYDKPYGVYLASYHYNDSWHEEDYYPRFHEIFAQTATVQRQWRYDSRATQNVINLSYSSTPLGEYTGVETEDASWPVPFWQPYFGTVIVNNDGTMYTYTYQGLPYVIPEYWQDTMWVDDLNVNTGARTLIQATWNEHAELKLFTGGKGVPGQTSLFFISAGAGIDPQEVHILGFSGDGGWISLPDNVTIDVTPTANAKHYQFGVGASKYTPYITANGIDLRGNTPEFCVGQRVSFRLEGLPGYLDMVSRWKLPGNYVNESYQYSSACTSYRINDGLLVNTNATSCCFVNGSGGGMSIGASLRFGDGKTVSTAAKGAIKIYRPRIWLRPYEPGQANRYYTVNLLGPACKLKLGKNDQSGDGEMSFDVNVNSKIAGSIGLTQLITAHYSNPLYMFSDERCDGVEYYSGPIAFSGSSNPDIPTGVVGLSDGPSSIWGDPNRISLSCRVVVRFAPGGGIPVTLGIMRWHTEGVAQNAVVWIITEDDTPDPIGPDNSDDFPHWIINQGGMH